MTWEGCCRDSKLLCTIFFPEIRNSPYSNSFRFSSRHFLNMGVLFIFSISPANWAGLSINENNFPLSKCFSSSGQTSSIVLDFGCWFDCSTIAVQKISTRGCRSFCSNDAKLKWQLQLTSQKAQTDTLWVRIEVPIVVNLVTKIAPIFLIIEPRFEKNGLRV